VHPIVNTTGGAVRGTSSGDVLCFRGIPYGAPTGGRSRFRPPVAAQPWLEVFEADTNGAACPQPTFDLGGRDRSSLGGDPDVPPSEDCLVLNLWTPATDDGRRPVLVWFHGGGYAIGAGTSKNYDGARLATRGDAVIVAVNHRIGPFGYLHLADLGGETFRGSGNAGNLDLVLVLEWVRDNAASFGGDPDNVTIFGESGGGRKALKLLTMPSAKGLFHRAIIQSGAQLSTLSAEEGTAVATTTMEKLGLSSSQLAELQRVAWADLLATSPGVFGFMPVVDGDVLPLQPIESIVSGAVADVPVIVGTTRDESAFTLMFSAKLRELDDPSMRAYLRYELGEDLAAHLVPAYEQSRSGISAEGLMVAALTDRDRRIPAIRMAEALQRVGSSPVYMYNFAYGGHDPRAYAIHGSDIPYTFDALAVDRPDDLEAGHVADQFCNAWLAFARSGDPNHAGLPTWQPYDAEHRATMVFEAEARCVNDPWGSERTAWDGIPVTGDPTRPIDNGTQRRVT
jgi:para-nitrobenzyl esterase